MRDNLKEYDVIIVGGGPVGLAIAIELGQRGVTCALIEKEIADHDVPKGQSLTDRTLELFHFWGCEAALRAARKLPAGFPIGNVTAYRDMTSPYWYQQEGGGPGRGDAVQGLFFRKPERLPQYETERVMRARVAELANVVFMRGWRVVDASQDADRVTVSVEGADGARIPLVAKYLVGADGSRSIVRTLSGITSTAQQLGDRMVLLVFRSPEFEGHLSRFPQTTTLRILKPELKGHWQFFGRIDAKDTFFFHAPTPRGAVLDDAELLGLMQNAAGFEFSAEIRHAGFWDLRISIADDYRKNRFFIAGDACHSHPPYGGFGLNSGLEDARNIGWKLAATLQGWGGETLLDSYALERRAVFVQIAEQLIFAGVERERAFLEAYSPEQDRSAFEAAWADSSSQTWSARLLPHYAGSPVIVGGSGESGIDGEPSAAARAGQHMAPAVLGDGRNLYEDMDGGFYLLALNRDDAALGFEIAAARLNVPLRVHRDASQNLLERYGRALILIRPDQYIAWAENEGPADAEAILRAAAGLN